jgi:choline kinase
MRAIILAAGQGFQLDGCVKLLIKDPLSGKTIIEQLITIFGKENLTIVVGYKAIEIIQRYPFLNYIYNPDWNITNNSYSLALALDEKPCYVLSSDLIISKEIILKLDNASPDCVLTANNENRSLTALNCSVDENKKIDKIYQGPRSNSNDPEAVGVYKISNSLILQKWKKNCFKHNNLFVGQNLPFAIEPIYSLDKGNHRLSEINTVLDMLNIIDIKK